MRITILPFAVLLLAGATTASTPDDEARFAEATAGLTPGKPVNCISAQRRTYGLKAIGPRLIYLFSRGLVYVNETSGGCEGVARGDILVSRSFTGSLCRGDIAETVDYPAPIPTGGCSLGAFVPYRKASGAGQ